jgi:simple sugar transport system ATP-binding protein
VKPEAVVEVHDLTKRFGGVVAVDDVDLDIRAHEVLALVGDNGAGKSTLIKMIAGVYHPSAGEILINGEPVRLKTAQEARALGIETLHQHLAHADNLPVWANMFLGRELLKRGALGRLDVLDRRTMRARARDALARLKVDIPDIDTPVRYLSGGQRQAVGIARALTWAQKVLILDEPTAALGPEQQELVLDLIRRVRDEGMAVVVISHSLQHVLAVADRIAVLRRGRLVALVNAEETSGDELVGFITGIREQPPHLALNA